MSRDQFYNKIDSFNDELINLRRHIHAHPELSGLENQTAILISGFLKNIGWNVRESVGRTGVVADFGPLDKGIIGLRVDMDALPIFLNNLRLVHLTVPIKLTFSARTLNALPPFIFPKVITTGSRAVSYTHLTLPTTMWV